MPRLFVMPSRRKRTRGQSVVELALIAPVFLILLLSALDLGRLLYAQITITNAAKEGALVASQGGTFQANQGCSDANTVMCGVLTEADGGFVEVDRTKVDLTPAVCVKDAMYPANGTPPKVAVSVESPFRLLTPIIANIVGSNLILGATADAECLVVPRVTFPALPAPTAAFTANPTSGIRATEPPGRRQCLCILGGRRDHRLVCVELRWFGSHVIYDVLGGRFLHHRAHGHRQSRADGHGPADHHGHGQRPRPGVPHRVVHGDGCLERRQSASHGSRG